MYLYEKAHKLQTEAERAGRKLSARKERNVEKFQYHSKYLVIRVVQKFTCLGDVGKVHG